MAASFFLICLLRRMTAVPSPRESNAMTVIMMPTKAPILSVTAPFAFEDAEFEVMGIGTPVPVVPVVVAAAAPILLVNVLAYVVVSVVVLSLAVSVAVYEDVKTE
jgi:hypothetical protein